MVNCQTLKFALQANARSVFPQKASRIKTQFEWPYLINYGKDLLLIIDPPVLVQLVLGLPHLVCTDGLFLILHLDQLEKLETGFEFPPILFQDLGGETLDAVVYIRESHFLCVAVAPLTSAIFDFWVFSRPTRPLFLLIS